METFDWRGWLEQHGQGQMGKRRIAEAVGVSERLVYYWIQDGRHLFLEHKVALARAYPELAIPVLLEVWIGLGVGR